MKKSPIERRFDESDDAKGERALLYGPVPSRRLGLSLGVDLVPLKTCTYNCVYCQLGSEPKTRNERAYYTDTTELLDALNVHMAENPRPDIITLAGSGEPTLQAGLDVIIAGIRDNFDLPVAIITNGSLLSDAQVRREIAGCDLIVPSMDAADQATFARINRPHESIAFDDMVQGLVDLRSEFSGKIWLEIMLVAGINDSEESLAELRELTHRIRPDKIHLNTVVRYPAESWAKRLTPERMEEIRAFFGDSAEVIASFSNRPEMTGRGSLTEKILTTVSRRPCSLEDLVNGLQRPANELIKELDGLVGEGKVRAEEWGGTLFYHRHK